MMRWLGVGLLVASAAGLAWVQPRASQIHKRLKETDDAYVLPPPAQLQGLTLGYRAAVADYLWSHVLVTQGLRMLDKQRFASLPAFLDAITTLDPTLREVYLFADALVTLQFGKTSPEEIRAVRTLLERGLAVRPLDSELWFNYGQFVGFVAPAGYLESDEESDRWRLDGSRALARATELGGDADRIAYKALAGATMLRKAGEREASIRFLEKSLSVTEDEELAADIRARLRVHYGEKELERVQHRMQAFQSVWVNKLPAATRTMALLMSPPRDPIACALPEMRETAACATTWKAWAERLTGAPGLNPGHH